MSGSLAQRTDVKKSLLPAAYAGPWPPLMLEALAYHEAGHAIMAAHHGMIIVNVWIADGRPENAPEEPAIHGACLCAIKQPYGIVSDQLWLSRVYQTLGPVGSEPMAPHYKEFHDLHIKYPQCFSPDYQHPTTGPCKQCGLTHFEEDPNILVGTLNDMEEAFREMAPFYRGRGLSPAEAWDAFQMEFRIPTMNVMKLYEPVVHMLAAALMKQHFMMGEQVHDIICRGNPANMPGCTTGIVGKQLHNHIEEVEARYRRGEISDEASYRGLLDRVGSRGPTGRGKETAALMDFLQLLNETLKDTSDDKQGKLAPTAA